MSRRKAAAPAEPAAPSRVELTVGGHQVVVEAAASLDAVAAKALELWQATDRPGASTGDGQLSVGFAFGEHACTPLMAPEAEFPYRLVN